MAFTRLKSIEKLRYCAPGEWGKLLELDRIPEARTLRNKVQLLSKDNQAKGWSPEMCSYWMELAPEQSGVLYIDGHVRVYKGDQTQLPRHHVARQKPAFGQPPTIGSMPWMDSLLWWLTRPLIPA